MYLIALDKEMEIIGKFTSATVYAENIEDAALQWVKAQCDHPAFEGVRIVQMPDVHAGNSCNVGTAYRIGAYLNPDHVGVDIGCTISMHRLSSAVAPEDFALHPDRYGDLPEKQPERKGPVPLSELAIPESTVIRS